MKLPAEQMLLLNVLGFGLLLAGIFVYRKMLRRVGLHGGLVRSDLFGLPDLLVTGTLVTLLLLLVAMQWVMPPAAKPPDATGAPGGVSGLQIIYGALQFALPVAAILALLIARGLSLPILFGLRRVGPMRAVRLAVGLILLLLPLFMLVTSLAYQFLDGQAESQELVKIYQHASKTGKSEILWQVMIAAVVIAPITEEILFRGYFYAVLKRVAGPVPAALGISMLFGAVHNNALGFPGLTLLALGLTLAYEWSGSLLVSIFMHASFNATSLLFMWWATNHGMVQ
jgi:membrane protease YdiL (CAAX protease family)